MLREKRCLVQDVNRLQGRNVGILKVFSFTEIIELNSIIYICIYIQSIASISENEDIGKRCWSHSTGKTWPHSFELRVNEKMRRPRSLHWHFSKFLAFFILRYFVLDLHFEQISFLNNRNIDLSRKCFSLVEDSKKLREIWSNWHKKIAKLVKF